MKANLVLLIPIIFLLSCTNLQSTESIETQPSQLQSDIVREEETNLIQYFLEDDSSAKFKGVGNEYASFTLKTHYLYENFVATYEDNGGTIMRRFYKISPTQITLIQEQGEAYEEAKPSLQELESMEDISIYLEIPLKVGTKFDGWHITSITSTVKSDIQNFDNVIVMEKKDEQGNLMRKFLAKDFGEIQREYISTKEEAPFTVSSIIERIEYR